MHSHGEGSAWKRIREEIGYWTRKTWTFADVGAHWDATEHYDDTNEETYSYFRRFTDGLRLSAMPPECHVLDICARTGNGSTYFYQNGKISSVVCADVSERMGEICRNRLEEAGLKNYRWLLLNDYDLPFDDGAFDAVLCFETVEHFPEPERMLMELGRVTRPGGTLVLTTPNVLWEPVHALAAVTGYHHSEGPHRFIRYGRLVRMTRDAGFTIDRAVTTILVPGGPEFLVKLGEWIEDRTPNTIMPLLGLRRILIGRKQ
jgi:SAM-dependent methyltransferase